MYAKTDTMSNCVTISDCHNIQLSLFWFWTDLGILFQCRSEKYLSGSSGVALIALVWVYANCAMIPGYLGVVGTWGYNCMSGKE